MTNDCTPMVGLGLMSGTSADGIDAAAVRLWTEDGCLRWEALAFETSPYPPEVRDQLALCFADQLTVSGICRLNARLGELFADAAQCLARSAGCKVDFAASHGQTVWHEPAPPQVGACGAGASTLQIGEGARIAERLGVPVVCDFRQQDMALGGQGAPLVPYVDHLLFGGGATSRAVQNLGGIANVTYLPAGGSEESVVAFDSGPANVLIDEAARLVSCGALECDRDGLLAAAGEVDVRLLSELMAEPYILRPPPKSTGRELFSACRVRALWDAGHRGPALVSTLTQFTVDSIALAYREWLGPVDEVIVGGGGARNPELVRRLVAALSPVPVRFHEEFGINSDAKEAIAFAVLGYRTLHGQPSNLPSATGASRAAILGKICRP